MAANFNRAGTLGLTLCRARFLRPIPGKIRASGYPNPWHKDLRREAANVETGLKQESGLLQWPRMRRSLLRRRTSQ
ncbi:MAG TPA: hypothetical protein VGR96_13230 [Acidobacteriaceae bacterium]|nr:hypothetical protein [Acidobacteriaceae bacterium]